jgi:hypothetical protein
VSETYDPNEEALDQLYRLSVSQDELDEFDDQDELDEEGQRLAENEQEHPRTVSQKIGDAIEDLIPGDSDRTVIGHGRRALGPSGGSRLSVGRVRPRDRPSEPAVMISTEAATECPNCGEPVDPNQSGVIYAVPEPERVGAVGGFFHAGCPPGAVGYVPRTLPGADLTTP